MSRRPSLSKSSTITPPACEKDRTPDADATSVKRPTSSADATAGVGIRCRAGTRAG